jgi:hypothetical protein
LNAQCLVYILGIGGIWNIGLSCVVMHNSEWKISFLWTFFTIFVGVFSSQVRIFLPQISIPWWESCAVCCRGQGRTSCPLPRGSAGGAVGRALGEMVWTSGPWLSWGGMCNYCGNYLYNYLWFQRLALTIHLLTGFNCWTWSWGYAIYKEG